MISLNPKKTYELLEALKDNKELVKVYKYGESSEVEEEIIRLFSYNDESKKYLTRSGWRSGLGTNEDRLLELILSPELWDIKEKK